MKSDNDKVLAAYHAGRARDVFANVLLPLVRTAVKNNAKQDVACSSESNSIVFSAQAIAVSDRRASYDSN